MPKTCNKDECCNPVFGGGFCSWHQGFRTDKKKPKKIKPFSESLLKELKIYRPKRDKFLKENPICMVPGCKEKSTLHHAKGRVGKLLYTEKYFRNLCWPHHQRCDTDPEWAYENNYSIRRNTI